MGERSQMTQEELDHLLLSFKQHVERCPDFKESDIQALEEVARVWKVLQGIRDGGGWVMGILVKFGSVGSALAVIYMIWKNGLGK